MTLSVVIVSYRSRNLLPDCLASLRRDLGETPAEVVVVDNASADGTVEWLRREHPDVRVLDLDLNTGFARAVNVGVATSTGAHVLLLNPDTTVLPGAIAALLNAARANPYAGLYGGRTYTALGELDPRSCWGLPTWWSQVCFAAGLSTLRPRSRRFDPESLGRWQRDTRREVGVITGCLLLATREAWDDLGGFDESFFMYGEDTDLSARARTRGWRPLHVPEAAVVHHVGASSASSLEKSRLLFRGKATFARKHFAPRSAPTLGVTLLKTGVALRAGAAGIKEAAGRTDSTCWRQLWKERDSWTAGWAQ